MSIIDIILIALILIGAYLGYTKGFLMEIVNTASFLIGIILGLKFWQKGASYVHGTLENIPQAVHIVGFVIVFVVVLIAVRLVGKIIKIGLDKTFFGSFDKILGAILGILKFGISVGAFLYVFMKYPIFDINKLINKSVICSLIVKIIPKVINWV